MWAASARGRVVEALTRKHCELAGSAHHSAEEICTLGGHFELLDAIAPVRGEDDRHYKKGYAKREV